MSDLGQQIDIASSSFRLLHTSPGHYTYGVWVNGGKCGDLVVRISEVVAFEQRMRAAHFTHMAPHA